MINNESLSMALSFAGCKDLPKAYNKDLGLIWIRSITLVKKKNGNEEYVISEQRASGLINHIADCGTMSPIGSVIRFYPYMYLDDGIRESCMNTSRNFLALTYPDKAGEILDADDDRLDTFRLQYAMDTQKNGVNGYVDNSPKDAVEAAESADTGDTEPSEDVAVIKDEGVMVIDEVVDIAPARKRTRKRK